MLPKAALYVSLNNWRQVLNLESRKCVAEELESSVTTPHDRTLLAERLQSVEEHVVPCQARLIYQAIR